MTDFYISGICRDSTGKHIQDVKIIKASKNGKEASVNSRQFVAELLKAGKATFKTIIYADGKWVYGANVHVIEDIYLTTDPNSTTRDNLGKLPVF